MHERMERLLLEPVRNRIVVNARDGSVLIYVPSGNFRMGDRSVPAGRATEHDVTLSAYWIGVYAVTNAQYLKFMEVTAQRVLGEAGSKDALWSGKRFPPEKANHPVVGVSWDDSAAYAKWAGCELASEAQWERACRGPLGLTYPWGAAWDESRCRHALNTRNEETCAVYDYPGGVGGWGTYNQSGNVWEWCADWYDDVSYAKLPEQHDPMGPAVGWARVLRGGSWEAADPGIFLAAYRVYDYPDRDYGNRGFRLVRAAS